MDLACSFLPGSSLGLKRGGVTLLGRLSVPQSKMKPPLNGIISLPLRYQIKPDHFSLQGSVLIVSVPVFCLHFTSHLHLIKSMQTVTYSLSKDKSGDR